MQQVADEEKKQPAQWWYMSFAAGKFLGACVVWERGVTLAIRKAHQLGCNPGGQVMSLPIGTDTPILPVNRLLSKEELGAGHTLGELEDCGMQPGPNVRFTD